MRTRGRKKRVPRFVPHVLVVFALLPAFPGTLAAQVSGCRNSSNVPIPDLTVPYRGLEYGLYPGGRTTLPEHHLLEGVERARRIEPLDVDGNPAPDGRIVLMSIGMSNTNSEFGRFVDDARTNAALNERLTIVNGALSGADAAVWTDPNGVPWQNAISRVSNGDLSPNQVQAIWVKQAHLQTAPFPEEIEAFKQDLASIVQIAKSVFPNLQMVFLSSRTRAGAESPQGPAEPQAYETAFGVRRLIEEQLGGSGIGLDVVWLGWGPYLWSNGTPRSDGFVWDCGDLQADLLHPSESGNQKVADQLMAFFTTSETTVGWFLEPARRSGATGEPIVRSQSTGESPLTVNFSADVPTATQFFWSFGDGTSAAGPDAGKTFHFDGAYDVRLTAIDALGNGTSASATIDVGESIEVPPPVSPPPTTPPERIEEVESGEIRVGYVLVTPDVGSSAPDTTATYGIVEDGRVRSQAGILPTVTRTAARLAVDTVPGIGRRLGVAITNPSAEPITVLLEFRDGGGNLIASSTVELPAYAQLARFVDEILPPEAVGAGFRGSLEARSTGRFAIVGLRFSGAEFSAIATGGSAPTGGVATRFLPSGRIGGTDALILPQFAIGGGWASTVALVNPGGTSISGRVDILGVDGNPMSVPLNGESASWYEYAIPPHGAWFLAPRDANGQSPF